MFIANRKIIKKNFVKSKIVVSYRFRWCLIECLYQIYHFYPNCFVSLCELWNKTKVWLIDTIAISTSVCYFKCFDVCLSISCVKTKIKTIKNGIWTKKTISESEKIGQHNISAVNGMVNTIIQKVIHKAFACEWCIRATRCRSIEVALWSPW